MVPKVHVGITQTLYRDSPLFYNLGFLPISFIEENVGNLLTFLMWNLVFNVAIA